ncbi:preprotein translocase subunit SecY [Candidatus Kaiserbacteria bacterium RIFCSPHIGHO2_02_FULL_50_50]|uniref:Protein translocase subunit SecY n=1 Tax=Candidatus Kaiserbacteria bacterium RIFCSPHIGHO2_02_FULL_50_50 TaxID=1798492 RepID=A0A1F6DD63_9BACT|nr:MAG: preprotein translocase subunit SecY [Candidatus Kaiserbacteria bacterium RIFCSPHIGHO2_02_FULL_50_50]
MHTFIEKLKVIVHDKALRNRIFFVLGAIALFRIFAQIPIPGANHAAVAEFFATNQFFGLFNVFSGGGLTTLSIMMLGVGPYITASIIMQLMTVISPKLKEMHSEEGEAGRAKFTQYSRLIALPLATLQGFGFLTLLKSQGVLLISTPQQFVMNLVIVVAGAMLLLWIGELVTEFGIGNGISIIIFSGIVASLPQTFTQVFATATKAQIPLYIGFALIAAMAIYAIVVMTQAERKIPTTHARQATAGNAYGSTGSYIPLRLNQAGVIPIIFALSLLTFPQIVAAMLGYVSKPEYQAIAQKVIAFLADQTVYGVLYFVLVLFFTYFYTAITFEPEKMSKNLQRSGAFIPGIRPGVETTTYLGTVVTRLTLVGALFLAAVALLPIILQSATGLTSVTIGGTAILIAVSVIIDFVRRVDAQVLMRQY